MPNVVRQTTSGTAAAAAEAVGVGWADEDAADVADCVAAWLDGEPVTGADTLELVAVEHADTSTANAADTTKTANREHLRPMSALSARCSGWDALTALANQISFKTN
jgi:hypothetical protein